jgi:hypothetical protein
MAGNSGNAGNAGNSGSVGAVNSGSSGALILPDRVDLPFVTVCDPPGVPISSKRVDIQLYPDRRWTAEWRAWNSLSQYTATGWQNIHVQPWSAANAPAEIDQLVLAARDERADALSEIIAQDTELLSYFMALLTMTPNGYPNTFRLLNFASIVSMFTVLHFKGGTNDYKQRPRPTHLCPALLPPIPVPGHPAYPSGHSTEAHLIAAVLNEILANSIQGPAMRNDLDALAGRIARNREIAGLHYSSDSAAGAQLATDILTYMKTTHEYQTVLPAAQNEWPTS